MARDFLTTSRHGTTFYFRRRVPDDLRLIVGKPYLVKSLRTGHRREAIILARAYAAQTDIAFTQLRTMPDKKLTAQELLDNFAKLPDCRERIRRAGMQLRLEEADREKERLEREVVEGLHQQQEQQKRHDRDLDIAIRVAAVAQSAGTAPALPQKSGKSIGETWSDYKAEKIALGKQQDVKGGWKDGEDTARYDHWPHVREFINLIGDKLISEVTADDVECFKQHVLNSPDGGKARNREKRLQRAGGLFRWAKGKRQIADDFDDLFRYPGKIAENHYRKFEPLDLVALFESDEYRKHRFKTPSEYWLPLIALFSGARLNELCQLVTTDIGTHDGIATISILDEGFKRLKTEASRRIVPIHSNLIELGFIDYVGKITMGRIFPELPEDSARPGNFAPKASELFTAYRRKCAVGEVEERSNKTFHSFRTTLIGALRTANVPKDRRTRLAGHEYDDTQDRNYDGGDVLTMFDFATLKADIELVRYDVAFTPYSPTAPTPGPRRGRKPTQTA